MNHIERFAIEAADSAQFAAKYLTYLGELLSRLDTGAIKRLIDELEICHKERKMIFIIGNGGSAATASHMVNDLGMDVLKKSGVQEPFRVMALTDNVALMTAIANDDSYENVFVNQLRIYFNPGDLLVAFSASGNSPNVLAAVQWVKERGGKVAGITGFDGGKLKAISDIGIHIETPKGEYGPVEDIHLVLNHLIAMWLQLDIKNRLEGKR